MIQVAVSGNGGAQPPVAGVCQERSDDGLAGTPAAEGGTRVEEHRPARRKREDQGVTHAHIEGREPERPVRRFREGQREQRQQHEGDGRTDPSSAAELQEGDRQHQPDRQPPEPRPGDGKGAERQSSAPFAEPDEGPGADRQQPTHRLAGETGPGERQPGEPEAKNRPCQEARGNRDQQSPEHNPAEVPGDDGESGELRRQRHPERGQDPRPPARRAVPGDVGRILRAERRDDRERRAETELESHVEGVPRGMDEQRQRGESQPVHGVSGETPAQPEDHHGRHQYRPDHGGTAPAERRVERKEEEQDGEHGSPRHARQHESSVDQQAQQPDVEPAHRHQVERARVAERPLRLRERPRAVSDEHRGNDPQHVLRETAAREALPNPGSDTLKNLPGSGTRRDLPDQQAALGGTEEGDRTPNLPRAGASRRARSGQPGPDLDPRTPGKAPEPVPVIAVHTDTHFAVDLPLLATRAQPLHAQRQRGAPARIFRLRAEHSLQTDGAAEALGSQAADRLRQRGLRTGNRARKGARDEGRKQEQPGLRTGTEAGQSAHPALRQNAGEDSPGPQEQKHDRQGARFRERTGQRCRH